MSVSTVSADREGTQMRTKTFLVPSDLELSRVSQYEFPDQSMIKALAFPMRASRVSVALTTKEGIR